MASALPSTRTVFLMIILCLQQGFAKRFPAVPTVDSDRANSSPNNRRRGLDSDLGTSVRNCRTPAWWRVRRPATVVSYRGRRPPIIGSFDPNRNRPRPATPNPARLSSQHRWGPSRGRPGILRARHCPAHASVPKEAMGGCSSVLGAADYAVSLISRRTARPLVSSSPTPTPRQAPFSS